MGQLTGVLNNRVSPYGEHPFRTEEIPLFCVFTKGSPQSRQGAHSDVLREKHVHEAHQSRVALKVCCRPPFYEDFRAVMHISPLQYAKSVKLDRAQTLIREGKKANEAGYLVGYNSPS